MTTTTYADYMTQTDEFGNVEIRTKSGALLGWARKGKNAESWTAGRFVTPDGRTSPYGTDADYEDGFPSADTAVYHVIMGR